MEQFIEAQKKMLEEEKSKIEEKIKKLDQYPSYGEDEEDSLQELSDYESNLSIEEQLKFLLSKINKAIISIDKGTYGKCIKCGENIEQGRLEIMPYADMCVTCSNKYKN